MTDLAPRRGRLTAVDAVLRRSTTGDIALTLAGAAVTAIAAQITVPLWPVPVTAQTFAVLLVGAALGARRGGLALLIYAVVGALGLPVFAGGTHGLAILTSPTGGYIIAFPIAAATIGYLTQRHWDRSAAGAIAAVAIGTAVIYAVALPWLAVALAQLGLPHGLPAVLGAGLVPFLVGDTVKIVVATALLRGFWAVRSVRPVR